MASHDQARGTRRTGFQDDAAKLPLNMNAVEGRNTGEDHLPRSRRIGTLEKGDSSARQPDEESWADSDLSPHGSTGL